jgi:hypothetical protein
MRLKYQFPVNPMIGDFPAKVICQNGNGDSDEASGHHINRKMR